MDIRLLRPPRFRARSDLSVYPLVGRDPNPVGEHPSGFSEHRYERQGHSEKGQGQGRDRQAGEEEGREGVDLFIHLSEGYLRAGR
jgi:hypothetical protein